MWREASQSGHCTGIRHSTAHRSTSERAAQHIVCAAHASCIQCHIKKRFLTILVVKKHKAHSKGIAKQLCLNGEPAVDATPPVHGDAACMLKLEGSYHHLGSPIVCIACHHVCSTLTQCFDHIQVASLGSHM